MGANAQTAVPAFVAGEILTAAEMTQVNTGIPVFATTTTRDAAFGGAGEKVLAQGQTCYIEATSTYQTYNGSAWVSLVTAPGLNLVKSQTIGSAVASVTITDAFSSTYENYKIVVSGGVASTSNFARLTLGSTATGYYTFTIFGVYTATTVNGAANANSTSFQDVAYGTAQSINGAFELFSPNLATRTHLHCQLASSLTNGLYLTKGGYLNDATQYTAFTLTLDTGTWTGGTVRVYGYANSQGMT